MYRDRFRNTAILASSLLVTMFIFAPEPSWAGCRNSGGGNTGFAYGSQVDGDSVTICASTQSVAPARKSEVKTPVKNTSKNTTSVVSHTPAKTKSVVTVSATKAAAKPVVLPKFLRPATSAPKRVLPFQIAKPAVKVKTKTVVTPAVARVVTKTKTVSSTATKVTSTVIPSAAASQNESAGFTPTAVSASVWPTNQTEPQVPLVFNADALAHFRVGKILGKSAEVMFTPVSLTWNFDDGTTSSGLQVQHAFASEGNYRVNARVVYAVSYRFVGQTSWVNESGTISMLANLNIKVATALGDGEVGTIVQAGEEPALVGGGRVALVGSDCIQRPNSFGCGF